MKRALRLSKRRDRPSPRQVSRLQRRARHHPRTVIRGIDDSLTTITKADCLNLTSDDAAAEALEFATQTDLEAYIADLGSDMREFAKKFEFEKAGKLRDTIKDLPTEEFLFA